MNSTLNNSSICSLQLRVYTSDYLFFKLLSGTYLRLFIGPGILLNTLCLFILSRSKLLNKSTTVIFLRFLAIFDILAITFKYIRAELNYQSINKKKDIFLITPAFCKILYVCMNACMSITMWAIVLMSLDRAVAVSYPLKVGTWITRKRAFYICCFTSFILLLANLNFITLSNVQRAYNNQGYCGLMEDSLIIDILTASILPITLITAINIVIVVILYRVSHTSFNWHKNEHKIDSQHSSRHSIKKGSLSGRYHSQSSQNSSVGTDTSQAIKQRTSAQVTRMLFAVTLSLIILNIPNTIIFLHTRIKNPRNLLHGRPCIDVSDNDIKSYKINFYSSVIQDILSDLPHIINFFLYCLSGRKFRNIFLNEVHRCFIQSHLIKQKTQIPLTQNGSLTNPELSNRIGSNSNQRQILFRSISLPSQKKTSVVFNTLTNKLTFNGEKS
ncbi:unnamed protein product [Rotaria sordida]|uniref:G-protein coupled receptors family 1 profile domain-containing protein n=1 Tax=Rotaria sordida TaxID=392033 RepID=A0A815IIN8_9BILA|nr:unnamed protein product [Rotaria sordida]CAF1368835.1 unnamed protein product [Rotaria sordida]CAF1573912.1 unnamed protein product [Rotaria sordida]CAF3966844.1 unnamed protein product [Rotaria sordida]